MANHADPPPLTPDGDTARGWAETELNRIEYLAQQQNLWQRLANWIDAQFTRFTITTPGFSIHGGWVLLGLGVIAVLCIAFAIWYVGPLRATRKRGASVDALDNSSNVSVADLHRAAQTALNQADWRAYCLAGFRQIYRTALDLNLIAPQRGRTAFEIARIVGDREPDIANSMWDAAQLFSAAAYSHHDISREDAATMSQAVTVVIAHNPKHSGDGNQHNPENPDKLATPELQRIVNAGGRPQ